MVEAVPSYRNYLPHGKLQTVLLHLNSQAYSIASGFHITQEPSTTTQKKVFTTQETTQEKTVEFLIFRLLMSTFTTVSICRGHVHKMHIPLTHHAAYENYRTNPWVIISLLAP
jgi:hypothetical protein